MAPITRRPSHSFLRRGRTRSPFTMPTATLHVDFVSVRNHNERSVYDAVMRHAERYPVVSNNPDLLADVACVALNRLAPRYIRHEVDFVFYLSDRERVDSER